MSDLRQQVSDYITLRRSLGFKLLQQGRLLNDFVDYLDHVGASTVTSQLALAWATRPTNVHPLYWKKRLSVVCSFSRYLQTIDPSVEVPAPDLLAYRYQRPTPYLYSETEIAGLIDAAGALSPPLRAVTYQTLFGLLAATGMRLGEAIRLDRADVDPVTGLILIRQTKFNKSRRLPLHPTTIVALKEYARQRDRLSGNPRAPSFFVSTRGTRLIDACVRHVFRQILGRLGLQPRAGSGRPRIHDLRHTFAVNTLRDWYRSGTDVAGKLPLLSAYLGHADPVSTYWYLQEDPELLALAAERIGQPKGVW
ncbi:MAG: tyrosine-type recombinase/integrase [Firmicutes bacterium]|nr:tyrosine-type recombinase/integrase [Bacillota bacterium]